MLGEQRGLSGNCNRFQACRISINTKLPAWFIYSCLRFQHWDTTTKECVKKENATCYEGNITYKIKNYKLNEKNEIAK